MSGASTDDILARLDRLESIEAIRHIVQAYGFAVDARDIDLIVALYDEDVRVGPDQVGRAYLKPVFDKVLRQFTSSAHLMMNHVIEFVGPDDALGMVLGRIEHEVGDKWVTALLLYHDRYVRKNGRWCFRGRVQDRLYMTAHDDAPVGELKLRWPDTEPAHARYYEDLPSWAEYWAQKTGEPAPADVVDRLVTRLRRTPKLPPAPQDRFFK